MKREFNVVIERDSDGVLIASVPGLRGCHTQASSQDELLARIREAIELRSRVGSDPKGRGSDMAPTPCSLGLPCLRAIDDALSVDPRPRPPAFPTQGAFQGLGRGRPLCRRYARGSLGQPRPIGRAVIGPGRSTYSEGPCQARADRPRGIPLSSKASPAFTSYQLFSTASAEPNKRSLSLTSIQRPSSRRTRPVKKP